MASAWKLSDARLGKAVIQNRASYSIAGYYEGLRIMKIRVLGAGRDIGKSCIEVEADGTRVIMDAGMKINPEPPSYAPLPDSAPDGVVISHAHLDHSGALPQLYHKWSPPAFMTQLTKELSQLLIKDSMKIANAEGYNVPYDEHEFHTAMKRTIVKKYGEPFRIKNLSCSLYDAGHIPGSSSVLLSGSKRILYTGDIQDEETTLLRGARLPKKADTLIIESTYAGKSRAPRKKEERRLIEAVEECIANNTPALMPVFAIGRAQEVLMLLEKYAKYIAIDGMVKDATRIVTSHPGSIKDAGTLREAANKAFWVKTAKQRQNIMEKRPLIISSAGMLGGGPAVSYLRSIAQKKEARVLFTGYLVDESAGWGVMNEKMYDHEGEKFPIKCRIDQFELSGHATHEGLHRIIKSVKPEHIVCVHGDSTEAFAKELCEMGYDAHAPRPGEEVRF